MPVDTSMYANQAPPMNPLATMGQVTQLVGGMNQNKLFSQEFAGRAAMGDAIKASTNPVTGETDWNKAMGILSQDPRGARMLPEFAAAQQARQKNALEIETSQQALAAKEYQQANSVLGALPDNATPAQAYQAIADLYRTKQISQPIAAQFLDAIPKDEGQFAEFRKQSQLRALPPEQRKPTVSTVDTGGGVQVLRTGPLGDVSQAGALPKSLSPSDLAQRIELSRPDGSKYVVTLGEFMSGKGRPVPGTQGGTGGPGGATTAIAPGTAAAATKAGEGAGNALNAMYADVAGAGPRIFNLQKALTSLEGAKTGPGTETTNFVKSFLLAQSPEAIAKYLPGVDPESIKNYDEANKYLQQYARGQAAATGVSEGSLSSALSANASTKISGLAAKEVVKANIGLERYRLAQSKAWEASGQTPENFNKWQASWNRDVDPRAFLVGLMSKEQLQAMAAKMSPAERKRFNATGEWAKANGLLE